MLHIITGPMYSGKTSFLINEFYKYQISNMFKVVCFKSSIDTRYDSHTSTCIKSDIISHDKKKIRAFLIDKLSGKSKDSIIQKNDVFIIDEIQFVEDALSIVKILLKLGKIIIVAGLNGDYKQKPFEVVSLLIPFAKKITSLSSVCCKCGGEASFTIRKDTGTKTKRITIGGKDIYSTSCGKCLFGPPKEKV